MQENHTIDDVLCVTCRYRPVATLVNETLFIHELQVMQTDAVSLAKKMDRFHLPVLSKHEITLRHWQLGCGFTGQQLAVCAHFIGLGMDFDLGRCGIMDHVRFAN